jgi:hypothetical protein
MQRLWRSQSHFPISDLVTEDGALVEPSGRKRGEPFAKHTPAKRLSYLRSVADGCHQLRPPLHGKKGVDGSSPSEGSAKTPQSALLRSAPLAGSAACGRYGAVGRTFASLTSQRRQRSHAASAGLASDPTKTRTSCVLCHPRAAKMDRARMRGESFVFTQCEDAGSESFKCFLRCAGD